MDVPLRLLEAAVRDGGASRVAAIEQELAALKQQRGDTGLINKERSELSGRMKALDTERDGLNRRIKALGKKKAATEAARAVGRLDRAAALAARAEIRALL